MRLGGRAVGIVVALALMLAAVSPARGVVWLGQPTTISGSMRSVSCVSVRACIAVGEVGYKGPPGAMGWDGRHWTEETVPNPGPAPDSAVSPEGLGGVSCTSATACIAVGQYDNAVGEILPMAVAWNGEAWSLLPAPTVPSGNPGISAEDVSCVSSSACMAVGGAYGQPVAEWWDGSAWSVVSPPSPGGLAEPSLSSVSCTSSSACMAVGSSSVGGLELPLAERWDGSGWTPERMPAPAGVLASGLVQVSCISPTACVAVGSYNTSRGQFSSGTLIERWNGLNWLEESTPGDFELTSVSCSSTSACTAVGDSQSASGAYGAVVERWDGSRWTLSKLPGGVGLSAVSCLASVTCTALGTGDGRVTAYQSAPASATLSGITAGCASAPFTVRVTGLGISAVTWRLGSQLIKGHSIRSGTRYAARIRLSPGRHTLIVKVKFQAYSQTRARTFRRIVVGCRAIH